MIRMSKEEVVKLIESLPDNLKFCVDVKEQDCLDVNFKQIRIDSDMY